MMGMWKAVRMLRVIILTIGWLVFSHSQTTSAQADEDVSPAAAAPSVNPPSSQIVSKPLEALFE